MFLPREPKQGQRLDASWGAGVIRYLRSITLQSGVDYAIHRNANGTRISPRVLPRRPVAQQQPRPLTVLRATEDSVRVAYGTVTQSGAGSFVPTIDEAEIAADPAPELEVTDNGFVYLHLDIVAGLVDAVEILFGASIPANDEANAYLELAQIANYENGPPVRFTVLQNVSGSQYYQLCDTEHLFGRI